jgi:Na+/glutamate symporter
MHLLFAYTLRVLIHITVLEAMRNNYSSVQHILPQNPFSLTVGVVSMNTLRSTKYYMFPETAIEKCGTLVLSRTELHIWVTVILATQEAEFWMRFQAGPGK